MQMTNKELLVLANTVKHNLDLLNPPQLQRTYLRNAQVNIHKIITELEDRITKTAEGWSF